MKRKTAWILVIAMLTVFLFNGMVWPDLSEISDTALAAGQNTISQYLDMNELTGFATLDGTGSQKLEGGVTGGSGGETVTVATDAQFASAVSDDTPRVVVVSGSIRAIDSGGYAINVGSNKTIVGADKNAVLKGGVNISGKSNIIVSNLTFEGNWVSGDKPESRTPDDCINVENSHHIWFNHLNIHDAADGNLDIKAGSNFITVSWCKFWYTNSKNDHRLSCLIGSGAGDHDDTDYGRLKVTYHHNWFADLCDQRMPRVMYGTAHVYNNYYTCTGNSYCIGAGCYATVLVENNYFKNVTNPHEFSYPEQTYPCAITVRGNKYDGTNGKKDSGQHPNASADATPFAYAPYPYLIDRAEDVPAIVEKYAGPQNVDPNATPVPKATPMPSAEPTPKPAPKPTLTPAPTAKPSKNDNPPTYVEDGEKGQVLQFNGQNSDRTNGFIEIANPFAGKDLSETPGFEGGYPTWTKGVSIAYWEYIPTGVSQEAPVLNFSGTHRAVHFQDWPRLEDGTEDGYQNRYQDNGGTYSLVREGDVTSGLQITSLAGFGYSEDDGSARDENPYSNTYGQNINNFQQKNYLYYFANTSGTRSALVSEKGKWHFVTVIIRNDLIQTYVDGKACSTDCFNYYGKPLTGDSKYSDKVNGEGFNMGYGWKICRRVASDTSYYRHSMPILEFLSLENTKLTIGGNATLWSSLGMNGYRTEKGIRLTDFSFYDVPLTAGQVQALMNGTEPDVTPGPTATPTPTPRPTATPTPTPRPTATPAPTPRPTATPTPTPRPTATPTPTPRPTATPTPTPRPTATPTPTPRPTATPTPTPRPTATPTPTPRPTATPTPRPTATPTPTPKPTATPAPTPKPTATPTPTPRPTATPTPTPVSYTLGDVDNDGNCTVKDAVLVLKDVVGSVELNDVELKAADVNGNGKADVGDALNILRMVVGSINKFPAEKNLSLKQQYLRSISFRERLMVGTPRVPCEKLVDRH